MKPWMASRAYFWEEAPFFRLLLPSVAAIICYEKSVLPQASAHLLAVLFATGILMVFVSFIRKAGGKLGWMGSVMLQICLFLAGWLVCHTNDVRNDKDWLGRRLHARGFVVTVAEPPLERERTWKLRVDLRQAYDRGQLVTARGSALVYVYKDKAPLALGIGDTLILPPDWLEIRNPGNPFEFDYAGHCRRNGLYHQQFLSRPEIGVLPAHPGKLSLLQQIHSTASEALAASIGDSTALGLMQAMLLGDAAHMDPELREGYARTGIIHIVAISGSHVMVLFQIIALSLFWIRQPRLRLIKYLVAVPLVCFYVAVAGAPVSAVRAAAMFTLLALSSVLGKDNHPLNQLFVTAFCMLLYEPMWLFAIGFQLSFVAVLSLILFYRPVYRLLPRGNTLLKPIMQAVAASIAAELLIAPLVIYYFHLFPATFLVANVVAYLFMGAVLSGGLLVILLVKVPVLAGIAGSCVALLAGWFNRIVALLQQLNPEALSHLRLSLPELLLIYVAIAGLAATLIHRQQKGLMWAGAASCLCLMLMVWQQVERMRQREFIVYNINKNSRAELIEGSRYQVVGNIGGKPMDVPAPALANHIGRGAWREGNLRGGNVLSVARKHIAVLERIDDADSATVPAVEYLVLLEVPPVFDFPRLRARFRFGKLVVSGGGKRRLAAQWRDSCSSYGIPAHFTHFDGAFVLRENRD